MDRFVIGRKIRARRRNTAAGQEIERYTLFPMIRRLIATPIPFARSLMPKLNEKKCETAAKILNIRYVETWKKCGFVFNCRIAAGS